MKAGKAKPQLSKDRIPLRVSLRAKMENGM